MAAAVAVGASQLTRSRCRGCLLGALLGDCLGGGFEGQDAVSAAELLRFVRALQSPPPPRGGPAAGPGVEGGRASSEQQNGTARGSKILCYSDDTAMAHSVVRSLLAKQDFDEVDMAKRFAEEYKKNPDRNYGAGVITVFKKLLSPKSRDVFEPARQQFNGKGSYGNGGAMRIAGISLSYSDVQDVKKFAKLSAELTHANSLGYNGAILQALAVHYALRGESNRDKFLEQLIGHMEDVEADDKSVADARMQWHCSSAFCPHGNLLIPALHGISPRYPRGLQQSAADHYLLHLIGWGHGHDCNHGRSHCRGVLWGRAGAPKLEVQL
ncbi:ADP-ribosylhydrolase ARH3 isoform X2 [Candoia aspera]|uniref:ADP-ribosylhydrolase ARH3 isoform X2 n=1 Tax=Candoia aspera TaxID=51853 RepID=UPI002FD8517E